MSLIFLDSFEHYSAAQTLRKWNANSNADVISPAMGRTGNGARIGTFSNISRTFTPEQQEIVCGSALRFNTMGGFLGVDCVWLNGPKVGVIPQADGRLYFSTTYGDSAPTDYVVSLQVWVYIELYCQLFVVPIDTTHYYIHLDLTAHANEADIGSFSINSPTYGGAAPVGRGFSRLLGQGAGGSFQTSIDDIYLCSGSEFLGDIRVGILYPNAVGDASDWTPTAPPNWANVKETPADDDATTVTANTTGQRDLYNLDDLPAGFTAELKGVQAGWCLKKSDAGGGACRGLWKSGAVEIEQDHGVNVIGGNYYPSYLSYSYNLQAERKSIFTGADWTIAEINALQLGIKRTI